MDHIEIDKLLQKQIEIEKKIGLAFIKAGESLRAMLSRSNRQSRRKAYGVAR